MKLKINEKNNKQGISLIVLVITIIVMIILAAAIILSLSSSGIIDRANDAVEKTDLAQVQTMASTIWAEAYLDKLENDNVDLEGRVINGLKANGIDTTKYTINVTDKGVEIYAFNTIPGVNIYFGVPYSNAEQNMSIVLYAEGYASIYDYTSKTLLESGIVEYKGQEIYLEDELIGSASTDGKQLSALGMELNLDKSWCPHGVKVRKNQSESYSGDLYCYICGISISLEHNDVIPEGGVYYVGVTSTTVGDYTGATATYEAGDAFPETVSDGDVYVYGDYEYRYNYAWLLQWKKMDASYNNELEDIYNSWNVHVIDDKKTEYGDILKSINKKEIKYLAYTFMGCGNLIKISNMVLNDNLIGLAGTFAGCVALEDASKLKIPNSVLRMQLTFGSCVNLKKAPEFPNKVTNIADVFSGCKNLVDISNVKIPSSVVNIKSAFQGCESLTGSITINATPETYDYCLQGTQITQILGDCKIKDEILATKNN